MFGPANSRAEQVIILALPEVSDRLTKVLRRTESGHAAYVRFGPIADMPLSPTDVCYGG